MYPKLRTKIESEAKSTVGYSEAKDKESFMVGVNVAFSKAEEFYEKELKKLSQQVDMYKNMHENLDNDMKTLTNIISKYSDND